ncbi:MAG: SIMPL domain-containing protein [Anaerolineae bacterium]|nr:SIMPL domain-containing protein [Anaerolineae bacterium]
MFKRVLFVAVAIVMVASLGLAGGWAMGQMKPAVQAQTPAPNEVKYNATQTITVVGQGTASIAPDIARITVGVETTAGTVADGSVENQAKMKALLAALKVVGIPEKDIQTTNYSIMVNRSPELAVTEMGKTGATVTGYTVSNNVTVTIRDLSLVGEVIDAAIEAGANNIWGISFTVEKPDAALADARAKAMADAKLRAEALARLGEVTLGPVMAMSEVIGSSSPGFYAVVERGMGVDTSVSIGEVEVSYQIQVSYYIEP